MADLESSWTEWRGLKFNRAGRIRVAKSSWLAKVNATSGSRGTWQARPLGGVERRGKRVTKARKEEIDEK